jgi:hypothetical protein
VIFRRVIRLASLLDGGKIPIMVVGWALKDGLVLVEVLVLNFILERLESLALEAKIIGISLNQHVEGPESGRPVINIIHIHRPP